MREEAYRHERRPAGMREEACRHERGGLQACGRLVHEAA